jgi:crossover junction endodeoxyribonuclease RuvC
MKVMALDPGYDRLGVAIVENTGNEMNVIYSTCLTSTKKTDAALRLCEIGTQFETLINEHTPDCVALESLFFNKNVKTALGVAEARGVIMFIAAKAHYTVYEYNPTTVKVATTGYGKSDKTAVLEMIKRLATNVPETALDDEYDAIAIGITCLAEVGRGR